jgi:aminoglycoside/choline kinase family phosphotransferase
MRRNLTLEEERDWYLERANDFLTPRKDRDLWQQLADELTQRIGEPAEQMTLW